MASPQLLKALDVYNNTLEQLERAEDNVQKALQQLRKFAQKSTFEIDNKYFQIRRRGGGFYLCELAGKPAGRPKGQSKKAKAAAEAAELLEMTEVINIGDPNPSTPTEMVEVAEVAEVMDVVPETYA